MSKEIIKKIPLILAIALLILVNIINFFIWASFNKQDENSQNDFFSGKIIENGVEIDCKTDIKEESYKIKDSSLSGFFESGSKVRVLFNYYRCNQIEKGDLVLYRANDKAGAIIKIVKGVPGDSFGMQGDEKIWNILINDKIITTLQGAPYQINIKDGDALIKYFDDRAATKEYIPIIPPNEYLLMGNIVFESIDGAPFGLVNISDIIGEVVYN